MKQVADRLRRVEDRMERLLASGWRNAEAEAVELVGEADALAELGLTELAGRLRRVVAAQGEAEALSTIALSLSAARLFRARLPADDAPPGDWTPLAAGAKRKTTSPDRLVLIGRLALGDGEVWTCVRLRGANATELVLVDPVAIRRDVAAIEAPRSAPGLFSRLLRGGKRVEQSDDGPGQSSGVDWLRTQAVGRLRWQVRYPLGAAGELERCALQDAELQTPPEEADPLAAFREALAADKLKDGLRALGAGGALQVKVLAGADADSYVWPDPASSAAFRSTDQGKTWALAWTEGGVIAPLAILIPGGTFRKSRLVHLVPGNPSDALAGS